MSAANDMTAPLDGARVVDLSRYVVGAGASRRLADLGASVVKVEAPGGGDRLRLLPPRHGDESLWHVIENAGKRSVAADLRDPDDVAAVNRLVRGADVVIESGGRNVNARRGVDLDAAKAERPGLVVCSITAFGLDGPWAQLRAHALNIDGLAGAHRTFRLSEHHGYFEELYYGGVGNGAASSDAAIGICAALASPQRARDGAWIEVSCWDSAVYANRIVASYELWAGSDLYEDNAEELHGSRHAIYWARDDAPVYFAPIERAHWERFCAHVERPDLVADDERPIDYGSPDLVPAIAEIIETRTAGEWQRTFVELGIPASVLMSAGEALRSEHAASRGLVTDGERPMVAAPLRWGRDGARSDAAEVAAPALGSSDLRDVADSWAERTAVER